VIRQNGADRELLTMRWGMPTSSQKLFEAAKNRAAKLEAKGKTVDFQEMLRMEPDKGTTNVRNTNSKHWKRWLGPENRVLVPFTSFSEFDSPTKENVWSRPTTAGPCSASPEDQGRHGDAMAF
jgi:putative SOS response-associated peptidase YedK